MLEVTHTMGEEQAEGGAVVVCGVRNRVLGMEIIMGGKGREGKGREGRIGK